ncbi:DUF1134 domain-containing protein [Orrella sp. NBD-18]|uniref:DUF1134 domain-containing protein n=1 Tax=Sheuella amnicola TaxID=2707330 RepID=A0A6B2QZG7_9BURK|nr:DUF1134 domain-containing protein [Sheuella amnicola]NDY82559.1 DUF1134 domain-containing protein [Sheuella amnicola]
MIKFGKFISALFIGLLMATSGVASAQTNKTPSGTVTIDETQFGFIVGGSVGGGVLNYKGKSYKFKIGGISVGANFGVAKVAASGEVFDLSDLSKFAGTYAKLDGNATIGGGVGGTVLKNEHGVIMKLKSTQEGLQFNLSANGVQVKLED